MILIVSFLPTGRFLPEWSSSTGQYDLAPNHVAGPSLYLYYKSMIELDVAISGANKDVYFYITDSKGRRVLDAGRIYDGYHLEWQAPVMDSYRLNFDNSMSVISHKFVNWSLSVFHYNTLFLFLGIGLLIVSVLQIVREEKVTQRVKNLFSRKPVSQVIQCTYCGATYNKTLDKCPNCGAPRKEHL